MSNAKKEFLDFIEKLPQVKCAKISSGNYEYVSNGDVFNKVFDRNAVLKLHYTETDYNRFLSEIDFDYNSGYGGQELFGIIWFEDNTWAERGEYDGSEWWEYNKLPEIEKECLNN
jgi:hypothetical protein